MQLVDEREAVRLLVQLGYAVIAPGDLLVPTSITPQPGGVLYVVPPLGRGELVKNIDDALTLFFRDKPQPETEPRP